MKKSPLLTIFLVVFFDLLSFGIVIPILPYYSKSFGASALALGWLMSAYSLAQFFCAPLWGSLSDRVGRRPVLLATILAGASAMVGTALAGSFWILFLARFLAGVFAANISTANAYIADVTTEENRAKGMGVIGAGFGLGFIFGPALGGLLAPHGYHVPILVAAGLGFANFVLAWFVLEEPERAVVPESRSRLAGLGEAFANPATALPIALFFLHTMAFAQLEVTFGFHVLQRFGYEAREAGKLLAGMGVVSAILQGGLIGRLAKRFGEPTLVAVAFFLFMLSISGAAMAATPTAFACALFGCALGMGIASPSLSSLASKGAAKDRRGAVLGVYQSAGSLARVLGPLLAGWLFDHLGLGIPFYGAAAIMAIGLVITLGGRRRFA